MSSTCNHVGLHTYQCFKDDFSSLFDKCIAIGSDWIFTGSKLRYNNEPVGISKQCIIHCYCQEETIQGIDHKKCHKCGDTLIP